MNQQQLLYGVVSMCCLRVTTTVFFHYFRIWKHVPEYFSSVICSTKREVVFKQKTRKKAVQTSLLFALSLQSLNLHQNWLTFFAVAQHPHIPYALRFPCVYWYHFLLYVQHWNRFHTQFIKQNLHLSGISEWVPTFYTTNCRVIFFFFIEGAASESSTIFFAMFWFFSRYRFYLVIIGKLGLNENKIQYRLRSMVLEQVMVIDFLRIIDPLLFKQ